MLGHSPGMGYPQSYQPHVFTEQTWPLAKYTGLSGSPKVNVEGNVRAVFSIHRRQLAVWNENRILISIDLHHSKTIIPTKDLYAIVKENKVSLCRLKFRSLPERVSFGAALADLVHVTNDKGASQDTSSQGWQSTHGSSPSPSEFSSQGNSEPGTEMGPDMEGFPRPSRVSTPVSTIQTSPSKSSPWRCYFHKISISPIPRSTEVEPIFKTPTLNQPSAKRFFIFEEENKENEVAGAKVMRVESPIALEETVEEPSSLNQSIELFDGDDSAILKSLGESMELFDDDKLTCRNEASHDALLGYEMESLKKEGITDLFDSYEEEEEEMNSADQSHEKKLIIDEEWIKYVIETPNEESAEEGEWGITHSFIARLREIPEEKKLKDGDVIRVKGDRALMHGHDCPCCREYYDALGLEGQERERRVDKVSRHRFVTRPMPQTPPFYWDIDFPSEDEQRRRGLL
ncbi:hypothetical protein PMAYCL1PPCAC_23679 [Pristionchus mayeri]|uniref:DNA endonuclease activator Ctp1 C-terminal domain-containing protein n=1 Tax=Pristionchus mayeri TaxID=1317129 RepID=A0AAN5D0S2_9BILA|nr:hypothetical protein PMAYCL1PPCAC_23679 [Pristionchus mayeri]